MKRVAFRNLELQARFQLDDQWWVKVDDAIAKHATYDFSIDLSPSCAVLINGEQVSSKCEDDSRKQMRKREGFLLALGTLLESIHWLG